ncbi:MAG: acetate--CoA ligase family protein [Pseudomonadota bacterium]
MPGTQADFDTTRALLAEFGIPVLGECVAERDEAISTARALGFPVVLKLVSSEVVHKSDAGFVLLDVADEAAVGAGWDTLHERARGAGVAEIRGVLVQPRAAAGFELLVGARQDPVFGPLTMVGHGGRYVELFKDVWPGVGVLNTTDAARMIAHTKAGRIIDGFRGPPLDKAAAVDLAVKVSRLMEAHPEVQELDLNPVILYREGFAIVDARLILGEPIHHPGAQDLSYERLTSLKSIFEAHSVAVIGASQPGSVGGIILKNSAKVPRLYPINPKRESLLGLRCYPSLASLPEAPDVCVFAVRPELTIAGFEEFCRRGGKGAIIVSDGFAEVGRHDLEAQLVATSKEHDVVYIGPNGLGVFDNFSGLNTLFLPRHRSALPRRAGPVGIISQSGGVGTEILEMAAADDLPMGKWVSCGNASGVTIPELLVHLGDDARIKVIGVYLEGLRNGRQFMEVARRVARRKPIIVIKGGMAGGAAATLSHTASLAGSFEAFKAACSQAGVYLLEELTEDPKLLINVMSMLTTQKPARGRRAAVVSVGGGAAILLADALTAHGLELTRFTQETSAALARLLPNRMQEAHDGTGAPVVPNPLDLYGDANDDRVLGALRLLNDDPDTDLVVMAFYLQPPYISEYFVERLGELIPELHKPLIMSLRGFSPYTLRARDDLLKQGVHTYTVPVVKPLAMAVDIWLRYGHDLTSF